MTSLLITASEWDAAASVTAAAAPLESSPNHGVAVVVADGLRWWVAWADDIVVTSPGFQTGTDLDGTGVVSPRLVMGAARLAAD